MVIRSLVTHLGLLRRDSGRRGRGFLQHDTSGQGARFTCTKHEPSAVCNEVGTEGNGVHGKQEAALLLEKKKKNFDATTLGFWLIRNMRVAGA